MIRLHSIHNLVQNFTQDTGLSLQGMKGTIIRWICDTEWQIGSARYEVKFLKTTVQGKYIELPEDAVGVMPVILDGHVECPTESMFTGFANHIFSIYGIGFINPANIQGYNGYNWGYTNLTPYDKGVYIDGCSCLCDKKVTVAYFGQETDCDGWPMIARSHFDAIGYALKTKYAERTQFDPAAKRITGGMLQYFDQKTERGIADSRATDGELTANQRARLVAQAGYPLSGSNSLCLLYEQ